jgi:hypothetical protein
VRFADCSLHLICPTEFWLGREESERPHIGIKSCCLASPKVGMVEWFDRSISGKSATSAHRNYATCKRLYLPFRTEFLCRFVPVLCRGDFGNAL